MGHFLKGQLQHELGVPVQFLHGGTPAKQRTVMVNRFQEDPNGPPIFLLSLKAGGTGLNLTRANHVFHFDRWWNPAVENQATDRAFRIGQKQNVQVHKFVCVGTMEEMVDDMIESKKALADQVVGSGEDWLTEISTNDLREMVTLRREALA
jgi:SNF2 family DNA or RNA helicase